MPAAMMGWMLERVWCSIGLSSSLSASMCVILAVKLLAEEGAARLSWRLALRLSAGIAERWMREESGREEYIPSDE